MILARGIAMPNKCRPQPRSSYVGLRSMVEMEGTRSGINCYSGGRISFVVLFTPAWKGACQRRLVQRHGGFSDWPNRVNTTGSPSSASHPVAVETQQQPAAPARLLPPARDSTVHTDGAQVFPFFAAQPWSCTDGGQSRNSTALLDMQRQRMQTNAAHPNRLPPDPGSRRQCCCLVALRHQLDVLAWR